MLILHEFSSPHNAQNLPSFYFFYGRLTNLMGQKTKHIGWYKHNWPNHKNGLTWLIIIVLIFILWFYTGGHKRSNLVIAAIPSTGRPFMMNPNFLLLFLFFLSLLLAGVNIAYITYIELVYMYSKWKKKLVCVWMIYMAIYLSKKAL